MDRARGGYGEFSKTEFRRCEVCYRPLIGREAEKRRLSIEADPHRVKAKNLTPKQKEKYFISLYVKEGATEEKIPDAERRASLKSGTGRTILVRVDWDTHGQPVFEKNGRYISPDADGHSGGTWKEFDRGGNRIATCMNGAKNTMNRSGVTPSEPYSRKKTKQH